MIIVNAKLNGENTYDITVGESNTYRVFAYNVETALDILADNGKCDHFDNLTVELMAQHSDYESVDAFAKAHSLVCCGSNKIYIPITHIKGGR